MGMPIDDEDYYYHAMEECYIPDVGDGGVVMSLSWNESKSHFIVCHPTQITVFKCKDNDFEDHQTISAPTSSFKCAVLGQLQIVASTGYSFHVWDWAGKFLYKLSEGQGRLSCHGNLLLSTAKYELSICVWDLRTGEFLKRFD